MRRAVLGERPAGGWYVTAFDRVYLTRGWIDSGSGTPLDARATTRPDAGEIAAPEGTTLRRTTGSALVDQIADALPV